MRLRVSRIGALAAFALVAGCAGWEVKYNPYTGQYEYLPEELEPQPHPVYGMPPQMGSGRPARTTPRAGATHAPLVHWVRKNIDGGLLIQLEDSSLWQVSRIDQIYSRLWLSGDDITVIPSDGLYPFKLVNTSMGEVVEAKRLK